MVGRVGYDQHRASTSECCGSFNSVGALTVSRPWQINNDVLFQESRLGMRRTSARCHLLLEQSPEKSTVANGLPALL